MGFFRDLGKTFGLVKSKGQGQAPPRDTTTPLLSDERGLDLFNRIKARSMGEGLGIAQSELDPASATFATRQRRAFREKTLPMISQQASSRGLGRSTIPINRAALEKMKTEESIAERISNIQLQNEYLKRQEMSTAIGREGAMVSTDVQQQNAEKQASNMFQQAEFLRQQGFRERADAAQQQGLKLLATLGVGAVTGGMGLLPGITTPGVGGAIQGATAGLAGDFGLFKPATSLFGSAIPTIPTTSGEITEGTTQTAPTQTADAATVNIGGVDFTDADIAAVIKILKGGK